MRKRFNIAGNCNSDRHYVMNNTQMFQEITGLIEFGDYFTINRPRQYGKTTMLHKIVNALNTSNQYLAFSLNFQGIDSKWHQSDTGFGQMFVNQLLSNIKLIAPDLKKAVNQWTINSIEEVSELITQLALATPKKLVLLIDEVDASSEYAAFVNFLGMLRNKYLNRFSLPTFHSVVLAGVHDIKNLKFKLRNPDEANYNSPWNIAIDFEVRMSFIPVEIVPMLEQYSDAEGVIMDKEAIAERLYYHTSGYPFLVSKLCKNIAEKILPKQANKTEWTLEDVEESVRLLLKENNTNFDSLIKNLENHKDLYNLAYRVIIDGDEIGFNPDNATIKKGVLYGVFKRNGKVKIHNRVYEQRLYNYLASNIETQTKAGSSSSRQFITESGGLDFHLVLKRFQQFMKDEYSDRDVKFLEREWRLLFLAFIRPIVNGEGYTFKEVQISHEKRLDVVVTYQGHRYIVELKKWYGEKYHQLGIGQLADYLEVHGLNNGYLLIFDERRKKAWKEEHIQHEGKNIYAVWL